MEQIDETLRAFVEALSSARLEENLGTLHALAGQLPPEDLVRGRIERILSWITLEQVYFSSTDVQFQEAVRHFPGQAPEEWMTEPGQGISTHDHPEA